MKINVSKGIGFENAPLQPVGPHRGTAYGNPSDDEDYDEDEDEEEEEKKESVDDDVEDDVLELKRVGDVERINLISLHIWIREDACTMQILIVKMKAI